MRTLLILIALSLASALAVVYMKHRTRMLFTEVESLKVTVDEYDEQIRTLGLEQNTHSMPGTIESVAKNRLKMTLPNQATTIPLEINPNLK